MGWISLALTLVNIACIWAAAAGTFYFKEVAPLPGKAELWQKTVPGARKFNVALRKGDLKREVLREEINRRFHISKRNLQESNSSIRGGPSEDPSKSSVRKRRNPVIRLNNPSQRVDPDNLLGALAELFEEDEDVL